MTIHEVCWILESGILNLESHEPQKGEWRWKLHENGGEQRNTQREKQELQTGHDTHALTRVNIKCTVYFIQEMDKIISIIIFSLL